MAVQGTVRQWSPVRVTQILFALTLIGLVGGLLMVFSASYPLALTRTGNAFSIVSRQAIYAALGFALFLVAWKVPLQWLKQTSWILHLLVIVSLLATLVVGKKVGDAQRWLEFGPFQVQPSEFAKVTLILCIAALTASWRNTTKLSRKFWLWLAILLCWVLTIVLVLKQPHLSGGLLLAVIGVAAMFFARMPFSLILATVLLGLGMGCIGQKAFLHSYQLERWRIGSWLMLPKGEVDEQKSYQVRQALLGLQVGGWFGQGFFQSRQKHLFLPSAHNDFIFAVIGEEFGFIGSVAVLTFFTLLAYFGLWVTSQTTDAFASGLSGGITVWVWFQALLHIAVNTHLLPPTGVPLPFVSAGGSALCAILIGMGLLLNVASNLTQQRKQKQRGGTNDALGDGRWGDGRAHLSSPRPRRRRQNYLP
ncbi:putative peptidoglycan glycosyltransferase FtsW [Fervidibacter sacchari]|uniref:Probable peptidoglycan glycosyltransferase FtsW n=1 Tax=Candidatus Fervidibacter sacchari TaxID=1448929 RepID=A0ABT2EMP0_9BACT|nr:putative peptidoglycan glycosyltransferase FtsW [Candidatus Fervidibacter sacchari]MCS3919191.1 cell division protein FtsW [Candidatus Fervidibacter sacchari]WKU17077.1 putative peptidoglycan glycosyltransferase FtsW [Candidatus Fervidibacter sacchari]